MLLTIVTGGLAVTVFALPFGWAVAALAIGNLVGAVFMALHAAQGPTLGVPQMVQTRGQFGSLGSLLVIGIVIVMYVGFLASNLVLGGEAIASLVPGCRRRRDGAGRASSASSPPSTATTSFTPTRALMTLRLRRGAASRFGWIIWVHGLPADFLSRNGSISPDFSA